MNLYTQISSGRFNDIYVGDYIEANDIKWLVADIDNYLNSGDQPLTKHHATIIPAKPIINAAMNSNTTTEGGYANSEMKKTILPNVLNIYVKPVFGSHILTYRTYLTTGVDLTVQSMAGAGWVGASNEWSWYESQIDLMSEINVYGANVTSSSFFDTGVDCMQYALFGLKPKFINTDGVSERFSYNLKNVSRMENFSAVYINGVAGTGTASNSGYGVRPRFLIG